MNTITLKPDDVVRILNMVYSVFLAILARFAIQQVGGTGTKPLEIQLLISDVNLIPVLLLVTYFLFDWLTANITVPLKERVSHLLLPVLIVGVLALGGLVAFSFVPSGSWLVFFGAYAFVVPWYDIIVIKAVTEKDQGLRNCLIIYGIILARLASGAFILVIASLKLWLHPDTLVQSLDGSLLTWIGVYVALKLIRYIIFLPLLHKQPQP
jgi:hypothetical protein